MQENQKNKHLSEPDILKLSNELIYRRYVMGREHVRNFFRDLNIQDYIALHFIREAETSRNDRAGRTYLKELAGRMKADLRQVSKMAGSLNDRGLVVWSHDGNGSEGTYVILTEYGEKILAEQEAALRNYYGNVIEAYGRENLLQLFGLMERLETVMSQEAEYAEAAMSRETEDGEEA